MEKFLIKFIVVLCFIGLMGTIAIIGIESEVVGETPCVDGYNRVNLEGIMCEESEDTWFGYSPAWLLTLLIPIILLMIWVTRE